MEKQSLFLRRSFVSWRSSSPYNIVCLLPFSLAYEHRVEWQALQMFDRFTNQESVEHLAGSSDTMPVTRPVQFTLIPKRATSIEEVSLALRHADHICTLLAHQSETIKNTCLLRLALIQHLFTEVC